MNEIAIIIPACIQNHDLYRMFCDNLKTFDHDAIGRIYVLCNRLTIMDSISLELLLQRKTSSPVEVICDKERSVAGAWNRGIQLAIEAGFTTFMVTAVDVAMTVSTINSLIRFKEAHPEVDMYSSFDMNTDYACQESDFEGSDFSCIMFNSDVISRHGWFDREYKPAYFEDNDYATRVVLGGGQLRIVKDAVHDHQGSMTIKLDSEMAHHVRHWFEINRKRFLDKWGRQTDVHSEMPSVCHSSPYQSGRPLGWWAEMDNQDYDVSGGIHD